MDDDGTGTAAFAGPAWRDAFRAVDRAGFVPTRAWATPMDGGPGRWIDRDADPDAWRAAVRGDATILTQVDDGATPLTEESAAASVLPSSSATAPSLVAAFLDLLDPAPGDRVLEIGTGTGWTAALLSHRLGGDRVTTVEVDPQVARTAEANLRRTGHQPALVVGDGGYGHPAGAPYDRVHATCGVTEVPWAWVEQTRQGGVIVAPWMPRVQGGGHRVRLTATGDGAVGRLHGDGSFMLLRAHRHVVRPLRGEPRESTTRLDPRRLTGSGRGCAVALAGLLPDVHVNAGDAPDGTHRLALRDTAGESHALVVRHADGGDAAVSERGPRDLWSEARDAYFTWVGWGEPGRERFGLTVDREGHHVWLDRPDHRIGGISWASTAVSTARCAEERGP
ncbi:methyltransferase domain-containing protein [Nocardiopsis trehalosi]|uniref:methyltransferase domain-containing protein n=1 Tax=Nocardiopsis trehalosi TaxID=109329 RepID=UPI00082E1D9D|nr:methyltransferase domain-containing protein [Nocardiopsis trehalosi]